MSFNFGLSKEDITPKFSTCLACSQRKDTLFERVHDNIFVRCAAFSSDGHYIVILSYDLLFHSRDLYNFVYNHIKSFTDIQMSDILINYTHNHNAPSVLGYNDFSSSDKYEKLLGEKTITVLNKAFSNMQKGSLEYGVVSGNWNINRRRSTVDGIILAPNPDGPTDKNMYVLKFMDINSNVKGMLINYACHPVHYPDTLGLTSEYPGHLCKYLEEEFEDCIPIFIQGAGADTRPLDTVDGDHFTHRPYSYIEKMAKSMASDLIEKLNTPLFSSVTPSFDSKDFTIEIPTEEAGSEYFLKAISDENLSNHLRRNAEYVYNNYENMKNSFTLHCGIIKLSETMLIIHMGGEPVCEVKFALEKLFNGYDIIFAGYTDGCAYIVTDKIIEEGGYEIRCFLEYIHKGKLSSGINKLIISAFKNAFPQLI